MFSYPHHIGDFIRDTSRLNDQQAMTYLRLMWLYYETEQPLPNDIPLLAFKTGAEEKTVEMLLQCYFYANALRWHHRRIDCELEAYKNRSKKASDSAKTRWKNANAMRTHSERNANGMLTDNREPITDNQLKKNIQDAVAPEQPKAAVLSATDKPASKTKSATQAEIHAELVTRGCTAQVATDFLKIRTAKRAPLTATAIAGIEREADKAHLSFSQAVEKCVERGWAGFEAAWLSTHQRAAAGGLAAVSSVAERNAALLAQVSGSVLGETIDSDARWIE